MTGVRPFGLRHLMLVSRLQNQGSLLDLEQALLRPRTALWSALLGHWSLAEGPTCTFVLPESRDSQVGEGFAQARLRPGGDQADIVFLAPSLDAHEGAEEIWRTLLSGMVASLARQRVERVFVRLADELEAASLFLDTGFTLYTREDVFQLERPPVRTDAPGLLEPATEEAQWGIARLYAATTPGVVRAAEGMSNAGGAPRFSHATDWEHQYIWEKDQEIAAYVRLTPGRLGHWMHIAIHPNEVSHTTEIVEDALACLPEGEVKPVYCGLRAYQGHQRTPLQDLGFRFLTSRSVLVRLNAVPATVKEARHAPALEKRAEAHTPTTAPITRERP